MSVENHTANLTAPVRSLSVEPSVQSLRDQFEEGKNMLLTVGKRLEKDRQCILELQNQMRQLLPIVERSTYLSLSVREDFKRTHSTSRASTPSLEGSFISPTPRRPCIVYGRRNRYAPSPPRRGDRRRSAASTASAAARNIATAQAYEPLVLRSPVTAEAVLPRSPSPALIGISGTTNPLIECTVENGIRAEFENVELDAMELGLLVQEGYCLNSECLDVTCSHEKEFLVGDGIFQYGLVLLQLTMEELEPASPKMPPQLYDMFIRSKHPAVGVGLYAMPTPTSWNIRAGDMVLLADPLGLPYQSWDFPEYLVGVQGFVLSVEDLGCEVVFHREECHFVPNSLLVKCFAHGDYVNTPHDADGTVIAVEGFTVVVRINGSLTPDRFDANTLLKLARPINFTFSEDLPSMKRASRCSWIGRRVLVANSSANRGYTAIVTDVRPSSQYPCGLGVCISYEVLNKSKPMEWVDYERLRDFETVQFLHHADPKGLSIDHNFVSDYIPCYSRKDITLMYRVKAQRLRKGQESEAREEDLQAHKEWVEAISDFGAPMLLDFGQTDEETSAGSSTPQYWIQNPVWHAALGSLSFYIQIHHGKWKSEKDQLIYLAINNGIEVRIRPERKKNAYEVIPPSDICDIPEGGFRTKQVPRHATNARGLYLIAGGPDSEHIGHLVRRISDVPGSSGSSMERDGLYLIQRVQVSQIAASTRYEEQLAEDEPFQVHYSHLLQVYTSEEWAKRGNRLVYDIRQKYGGQMLLQDKPQGTELLRANRAKKQNLESGEQLQERIRKIAMGIIS
ncbi:hypothetical protein GYMLUDRAFT_244253 [Collybiopsis luxurians FD-317 M1]|uniref:Uncharacterized protein n=1 Tax=Collybiopsis luxurians FD-317 M1 TaxID=944289 RepID=A0A0D0CDX8_9AGAR|nr:hypothetical protein GYMLUDRAFT_244253 [Collybiopsis luxurians FD-317 M1]